jgi:hypothetical protein
MGQSSGRKLGCQAEKGEAAGVGLYFRKDPSQKWIDYTSTYRRNFLPLIDSRNEYCKGDDPDFCIYRTTDGGNGYVGRGYIMLRKFNPDKHSGYYRCVTFDSPTYVQSKSFFWKVSLAGTL